jgi:STIMATE family
MSLFSTGQLAETLAKAAADAIKSGSEAEGYQPNPCSFYLLNLAIDTTVGILVLILILRVLTVGVSYTPLARPPESIQSGNYGTPPKTKWWLKQSLIYFFGLLGMKACVFLIFELCPWIIRVGDWALRWTEGNEAIQIAFVMLIFPLIMNALQYYIIDTFIKKKATSDEDQDGEHDDAEGEDETLLPEEDREPDGTIEVDEMKSQPKVKVRKSKRIQSYDPDKDGEIPGTPVTGESSNSSVRTGDQEPIPKTLEASGGP